MKNGDARVSQQRERSMTRSERAPGAFVLVLLAGVLGAGPGPRPWGPDGHAIVGRVAASGLPADLPEFFRSAARHLAYLNYEPDRWRVGRFPEMDHLYAWDHYINLERVTPEALEAEDRYAYLDRLARAGLADPARAAGLLPFRILELYERLTVEFGLWRRAADPDERRWVEERILNDAGVLGHYVADGANPHHATVHFNGWAEGYANPEGFTADRTFHRRFEMDFVGAHIREEDVAPRVTGPPRQITEPRGAILDFIRASYGLVHRLYELERDFGFSAERVAPQTRAFAVERLAAGAEMLRALWWSAWRQSAALP